MNDSLAALVSDVNGLAIAARVMNAPPADVVDKVSRLVREARAALDEHGWAGPYAVEQLAPPGDGMLVWDPADLRKTVPYSPILGRLNPTAGPSRLRCEDGQVIGSVTLSPLHVGPVDSAHGGVVAALLDELASLAVLAAGGVGYTQTLTVSYRRRTPVRQSLELRAHTAGLTGETYLTTAEIRHAGEVTASAIGMHRSAGDRDDVVYR
jgi:acyl-coenzyme A thioesterase PaaI-like protein